MTSGSISTIDSRSGLAGALVLLGEHFIALRALEQQRDQTLANSNILQKSSIKKLNRSASLSKIFANASIYSCL